MPFYQHSSKNTKADGIPNSVVNVPGFIDEYGVMFVNGGEAKLNFPNNGFLQGFRSSTTGATSGNKTVIQGLNSPQLITQGY